MLVEGRKAVSELITSEFEIETVLGMVEEDIERFQVCSKEQMAKISSFRTPSDLIAVAKIPEMNAVFDLIQGHVFVLDSIRDPGNLGTIIRTVRWFGAEHLILSEDCADAFNPKTIQASMGAVFHLQLHYTELRSAIPMLKSNGYTIVGTDMKGQDLSTAGLSNKDAIVIGNEGHGMSEEVQQACDRIIRIEGAGLSGVESLNAAMSVGIIAHHLFTGNGN